MTLRLTLTSCILTAMLATPASARGRKRKPAGPAKPAVPTMNDVKARLELAEKTLRLVEKEKQLPELAARLDRLGKEIQSA